MKFTTAAVTCLVSSLCVENSIAGLFGSRISHTTSALKIKQDREQDVFGIVSKDTNSFGLVHTASSLSATKAFEISRGGDSSSEEEESEDGEEKIVELYLPGLLDTTVAKASAVSLPLCVRNLPLYIFIFIIQF